MKRGIILAAMLVIAVALAGCAFEFAFPAFTLPSGGETQPNTGNTKPSAKPQATKQIPKPSASSTPAPTAMPSSSDEPYKVVTRYDSTLPEGLTVGLSYSKYATSMNYFVALKSGKVYSKPDANAKKLLSFTLGTRYRTDREVLGTDGKTRWYHVLWSDKKGSHDGYIRESSGKARSFRLGLMLDRAKALKENTDTANTVYITNYKNGNGKPLLLPGGREEDPAGNRRDQSAPAYQEPSTKSSFRYAPDGLLGTRLETSGNLTKVFFPTFGEARWVPAKYLSKSPDCITTLRQVVVVDRSNQNAAAFEYSQDGWKLISMTFVSTGKSGGYSLKTPLGDFMAQDRYSKFYYYKDGTTNIEGYAPWAVRFSGGGYLHGVPRKSTYDDNGIRHDPLPGESLSTLGTTPQSHMCVRNYTSYAKFIYDWYVKGACAVIVLE